MGYGIGSLLALCVSFFANRVGFDRDRAFYPTVLIVVGSYYVLFAAMGATSQALLMEVALLTVFLLAAVAGFKFNMWAVVAGLAGHGVLDFFHAGIVTNPGVPEWWPAFCSAYDLCAAGCLAWLLTRPNPSSPRAHLSP